jgi:hypothetical protein
VADGDRTTLLVAVAGIAATALVGVAGTTAGWLSARADRSSQRALERDDRVFSRRAAVYLDAIGLLEAQKKQFADYANSSVGERIPYQRDPDEGLTERLIALGSAPAVAAFDKAEELNRSVSTEVDALGFTKNGEFIQPEERSLNDDFISADKAFIEQIRRFEQIVHKDLAT